MVTHKITKLTPNQAQQLVGRIVQGYHRGGDHRSNPREFTVRCVLVNGAGIVKLCSHDIGWWLADGDYITVTGDLPWEASDAPESDAAPEACETPRERVERLTVELSDAQDALAREGLPEGWRRLEDDIYGPRIRAGSDGDLQGLELWHDAKAVVMRGHRRVSLSFDAIAAFVDIVREQRAENA